MGNTAAPPHITHFAGPRASGTHGIHAMVGAACGDLIETCKEYGKPKVRRGELSGSLTGTDWLIDNSIPKI